MCLGAGLDSIIPLNTLSIRIMRVVGDIHGDLRKAIASLEAAQVLQEQDGQVRWAGGDTVVVQLGDVLDRGDSEIGMQLASQLLPTSLWSLDYLAWMKPAILIIDELQVLSCCCVNCTSKLSWRVEQSICSMAITRA